MLDRRPLGRRCFFRRYDMTDAAESAATATASRRLVFLTTETDALALEAILKPADRGWRSLLGYAFALPPLVVISWFTRNAEWPVWFAAFGAVGLVAWQGARFALKVEQAQAARRHPTGAGQIDYVDGRLMGAVGGATVDISASSGVRVEADLGHLYILASDRPALILPLSAFTGKADMTAFAAAFEAARR